MENRNLAGNFQIKILSIRYNHHLRDWIEINKNNNGQVLLFVHDDNDGEKWEAHLFDFTNSKHQSSCVKPDSEFFKELTKKPHHPDILRNLEKHLKRHALFPSYERKTVWLYILRYLEPEEILLLQLSSKNHESAAAVSEYGDKIDYTMVDKDNPRADKARKQQWHENVRKVFVSYQRELNREGKYFYDFKKIESTSPLLFRKISYYKKHHEIPHRFSLREIQTLYQNDMITLEDLKNSDQQQARMIVDTPYFSKKLDTKKFSHPHCLWKLNGAICGLPVYLLISFFPLYIHLAYVFGMAMLSSCFLVGCIVCMINDPSFSSKEAKNVTQKMLLFLYSQRKMFKTFESHIKLGGILAFTSGEEEGEIWSDNGGQELYHASLSTNEYEGLLKAASFKVLLHKVFDPECGEATVWVAKKGQ